MLKRVCLGVLIFVAAARGASAGARLGADLFAHRTCISDAGPDYGGFGCTEGNETRIGPGVGGVLETEGHLGLHVEANVLSVSFGAVDRTVVVNRTVNYIEMPVLAKLCFVCGDTRVYIVAGPAVAVRLNTPDDITFGEFVAPHERSDGWKRMDATISFGVGVEHAFGSSARGFVQARYDKGIANTYDDGDIIDQRVGPRLVLGVVVPLGRH